MSFNLESLPFSSASPGPFAKQFKLKTDTDESEQVVKAVKRAKSNQCRIYVIKNNESCGFIAISLSTVGDEELPMLVLDYAPTDVVFDEQNIVQPDLLVVCDQNKITERTSKARPIWWSKSSLLPQH